MVFGLSVNTDLDFLPFYRLLGRLGSSKWMNKIKGGVQDLVRSCPLSVTGGAVRHLMARGAVSGLVWDLGLALCLGPGPGSGPGPVSGA